MKAGQIVAHSRSSTVRVLWLLGGLVCAGAFTTCTEPVSRPVVRSVAPNNGPLAGGTEVTIYGARFPATIDSARIGSGLLGLLVRLSEGRITGVMPAGSQPGAVDVTVYAMGGASTCTGCFAYNPLMTVAAVKPASGSSLGGLPVEVIGANFPTSVDSVLVGAGRLGNLLRVSDTLLTGTTPADSIIGSKNVTVFASSRGSGTCSACFSHYRPFTVTAVTPASGPRVGGTMVAIVGANFPAMVDSVRVGAGRVTSLLRVSDTLLTGGTPSDGTVGTKDVTVFTSSNGSGTCQGCFAYYALLNAARIQRDLGGVLKALQHPVLVAFDTLAGRIQAVTAAAPQPNGVFPPTLLGRRFELGAGLGYAPAATPAADSLSVEFELYAIDTVSGLPASPLSPIGTYRIRPGRAIPFTVEGARDTIVAGSGCTPQPPIIDVKAVAALPDGTSLSLSYADYPTGTWETRRLHYGLGSGDPPDSIDIHAGSDAGMGYLYVESVGAGTDVITYQQNAFAPPKVLLTVNGIQIAHDRLPGSNYLVPVSDSDQAALVTAGTALSRSMGLDSTLAVPLLPLMAVMYAADYPNICRLTSRYPVRRP